MNSTPVCEVTIVSSRWKYSYCAKRLYLPRARTAREERDVYTWRPGRIYVEAEMYIHKNRHVLSRKTIRPTAKDDTSYGGRPYVLRRKRPAPPLSNYFFSSKIPRIHRLLPQLCNAQIANRRGESVDAGDFREKVFIFGLPCATQ